MTTDNIRVNELAKELNLTSKEVLEKFAGRLEAISTIEQQAKLDGRSMTMLLAPIKDNK